MAEQQPDFGHFDEDPAREDNMAAERHSRPVYDGSVLLGNLATAQVHDRPLTSNTHPSYYFYNNR